MSEEELCERIFQLEKENSELKAKINAFNDYLNDIHNTFTSIEQCENYIAMQNEQIDRYNIIIKDQREELNIRKKVIYEMAEVLEECRQNDCLDMTELDIGEIAGPEQLKEYFYKKVYSEKEEEDG